MTDSNTPTIPGIVRERVARGLAWIIENGEQYHLDLNRVDLDTLDISSPSRCVLGQARHHDDGAWSGYAAVMAELFDDDRVHWHHAQVRSVTWARVMGFEVDTCSGDPWEYTEAWRQAILAHREGSATATSQD